MKQKKSHDESKRFPEYYKKHFPELSIEECENQAEFFRKSCNSGCIEYYIKRFPNLSYNEQLQKLEEHKQKANSNNKLNFSYYKTNFPELSEEEQRKLFHEYVITKNYQCKEYYLANGYSEEDAIMLAKEHSKSAAEKISKKVSGELNGMHSSKTTQEQRNSVSPRNIAFYERKYPELTHEEHLKLQQDFFEKNRLAVKKAIKPTNIEYYLNQGMSEDDAKEALRKRQATFSLYKCIKKYGEEKGLEIFNKRQKIWNKNMQKTYKNGKYTQSPIAKKLFEEIINRIEINHDDIIEEKYIFNDNLHKGYLFDFSYKNKLIEFNGDYWHANPTKYKETDFIKAKNQSAKQIWEYDKIKIETAKLQNFKVLIIWESEYNENKEKTIQKCIDFIKNE